MTVGIVLIRSSQCWSSLNILFNLEGNWSHWDGDLLPTIQNHGRQVIRSPQQRIEAVKPETFGWKTTLPVMYKLWSLLLDIFKGFALMLRVRCVRLYWICLVFVCKSGCGQVTSVRRQWNCDCKLWRGWDSSCIWYCSMDWTVGCCRKIKVWNKSSKRSTFHNLWRIRIQYRGLC
jgi:hypothetical protein